MSAIDGEELKKWEKMHGTRGHDENILVLVRLRPLNEKELLSDEASDWGCINETAIIYTNTLREGSMFPRAYTFDRVFQGDCSTRQVYEDGVREVALSVVAGINSSIFAYGQTCSGKTYTMTGITEYAVADILDYIHRHQERSFKLKFSALEIYNEVVTDLLSTDHIPLRLLDDPERGTIIENISEESLRDLGHLEELLCICEAQRQAGETHLNGKSSRSHQIIKLKIESSAREFLGKDNSTALLASVNFIDLAGSERASEVLSTGPRLKEASHINKSLLTLGTVIRKLSKERTGHINYRDSKLTRILQPSFGGNARTAIICTLSPARSHVEQTRNTLMFASCAKQVTTKAQVNVVMSDKALVKQLRTELARLESELRIPAHGTSSCDCAKFLRMKDRQIEKMEKEIRQVMKQRDLACSRIEDLLHMVENDRNSRQGCDTREDDCSMSDSPNVINSKTAAAGIRKFDYPHSNFGINLEDIYTQILENAEKYSQSHGDLSDYCKEVQCVKMEESTLDNSEHIGVSNEALQPTVAEHENLNTQKIVPSPSNVHLNFDSHFSTFPDKSSLHATPIDVSDTTNSKLTRNWNFLANLITESPDMANQVESTPPNVLEGGFSGRPENLLREHTPLTYGTNATTLSRNNSFSSRESASFDDFRSPIMETNADEDITSFHTFFAGLKAMAELQYGKQPIDSQGQEDGIHPTLPQKNLKDVGVCSMVNASGTPQDWPLEFERRQRKIIELWQVCHVSLIHRTYFFLLFRGDPADSIYMEVELRRLTFLKETFSHAYQAAKDGQISNTLASSMKHLCHEREKLSKLMQKRMTEDERRSHYQKWGIPLDSKRRRLQLANRLWNNTEDIKHVMESAAIVGKLVKFVEQGHTLKEMFGLSFAPPQMKRRFYSTWIKQ